MSDDLISRKEALAALCGARIYVAGMRSGKVILTEYAKQCRAAMIESVRAVPAADAEYVKHGSWHVVGHTEKGTPIVRCSVCRKERKGIAKSAYCRDCGAKMDLVEITKDALDALLKIGQDAHFTVLDDEQYEQDGLWPKENPYLTNTKEDA